ncbi:HotDog domain-containing protein [Poronia punctata]|nr:HotDog domain-containing protein [Poronia punctata]
MSKQKQKQEEDPNHKHFASIPWCIPHLTGPNIRTQTPTWRIPSSTGEQSFFSETLNTTDTITHMLEIYTDPSSSFSSSSPPTSSSSSSSLNTRSTDNKRINEFKVLLTIGPGVQGHRNLCHGGFITAVLDETVGLFIPINLERGAIPKGMYMTAYLNTSFKRPVECPATVLVETRLVRVEGRKFFTEGRVFDEGGRVLAECEALYVLRREGL